VLDTPLPLPHPTLEMAATTSQKQYKSLESRLDAFISPIVPKNASNSSQHSLSDNESLESRLDAFISPKRPRKDRSARDDPHLKSTTSSVTLVESSGDECSSFCAKKSTNIFKAFFKPSSRS